MTSGGGVLARTPDYQSGCEGSIPIPPLQLRVEAVEYAHVRPYVLEYHYLHRDPTIPRLSFAVFHGWRCVGAVVYGQPAARLEDQEHTWELRRYWLSDECAPNSESRVLGYTIRYIRRNFTEVHRLISYSDTSMGHGGTIYRATGWTDLGAIRIRGWKMPNRVRRDPRVNGTKHKWELLLPPANRHVESAPQSLRDTPSMSASLQVSAHGSSLDIGNVRGLHARSSSTSSQDSTR